MRVSSRQARQLGELLISWADLNDKVKLIQETGFQDAIPRTLQGMADGLLERIQSGEEIVEKMRSLRGLILVALETEEGKVFDADQAEEPLAH